MRFCIVIIDGRRAYHDLPKPHFWLKITIDSLFSTLQPQIKKKNFASIAKHFFFILKYKNVFSLLNIKMCSYICIEIFTTFDKQHQNNIENLEEKLHANQ